MKPLWNIFYKTFVVEYYRLNIGLLAVIMLFAGGFLRSEDHIALATYCISSPFLLLSVFGLWLVYHLKTIYFIRQRLLWPENQFLFSISLISKLKRLALLYFTQYYLWVPVMTYGVFMIGCGWRIGAWTGIGITALFLLLVPISAVWFYEFRIQRPNPDHKIDALGQFFNQQFTKPLWSYFVFHLFKQDPILFLTTKITALFVLGFCRLYPTDDYDERLLSLAGLFTIVGHSVMMFRLHEFEYQRLPILRNMPVRIHARCGQYAFLFFCLLLPEITLLIRNLPKDISLIYTLCWSLFVVGGLFVYYCRLLMKPYDIEMLLRQSFWALIAVFFVIMFKIPISIMALALWTCAFLVFRRFYYNSEFSMTHK